MRLILVSLVLAAPALAISGLATAQDRIPKGMLDEHNRACVSECMQNRDEAYCVATCDCVAREIGESWTAEEYHQRAAGLSGDDPDPVNQELTQIAAYCARQAQ